MGRTPWDTLINKTAQESLPEGMLDRAWCIYVLNNDQRVCSPGPDTSLSPGLFQCPTPIPSFCPMSLYVPFCLGCFFSMERYPREHDLITPWLLYIYFPKSNSPRGPRGEAMIIQISHGQDAFCSQQLRSPNRFLGGNDLEELQ